MPDLPIRPHFKGYGRTERGYQKALEFNRMAQRVADHVHSLILQNPAPVQMYAYFEIARPLGLEIADVRRAISRGGGNGITFGVDAADREALAIDLQSSKR
jgi:hypothetical protein